MCSNRLMFKDLKNVISYMITRSKIIEAHSMCGLQTRTYYKQQNRAAAGYDASRNYLNA